MSIPFLGGRSVLKETVIGIVGQIKVTVWRKHYLSTTSEAAGNWDNITGYLLPIPRPFAKRESTFAAF